MKGDKVREIPYYAAYETSVIRYTKQWFSHEEKVDPLLQLSTLFGIIPLVANSQNKYYAIFLYLKQDFLFDFFVCWFLFCLNFCYYLSLKGHQKKDTTPKYKGSEPI